MLDMNIREPRCSCWRKAILTKFSTTITTMIHDNFQSYRSVDHLLNFLLPLEYDWFWTNNTKTVSPFQSHWRQTYRVGPPDFPSAWALIRLSTIQTTICIVFPRLKENKIQGFGWTPVTHPISSASKPPIPLSFSWDFIHWRAWAWCGFSSKCEYSSDVSKDLSRLYSQDFCSLSRTNTFCSSGFLCPGLRFASWGLPIKDRCSRIGSDSGDTTYSVSIAGYDKKREAYQRSWLPLLALSSEASLAFW